VQSRDGPGSRSIEVLDRQVQANSAPAEHKMCHAMELRLARQREA